MIVLDTHALVWWVAEPARLSRKAARAIATAVRGDGVTASAVSLFEIGTLLRRGRLVLTVEPAAWLAALQKLPELAIEPAGADVALQAASYGADFSGDPADRLIAATAQLLGAKLVTADDRLRAAKVVDTLW